MTGYQLATIALGAAGFIITWGLGLFKAGRMVEQMQASVKEKVDAEKLARMQAIDDLREEFAQSQKSQDHNVGEMGAALRRHIEAVHEKLREVEIWGRDNYIQKPEMENLRQDIKELARSIKDDFKDLHEKMDRRPS